MSESGLHKAAALRFWELFKPVSINCYTRPQSTINQQSRAYQWNAQNQYKIHIHFLTALWQRWRLWKEKCQQTIDDFRITYCLSAICVWVISNSREIYREVNGLWNLFLWCFNNQSGWREDVGLDTRVENCWRSNTAPSWNYIFTNFVSYHSRLFRTRKKPL